MSQDFIELNLSQNRLGDEGLSRLCQLYETDNCYVKILKLRACSFTSGRVFDSLKYNSSLKELNLAENCFSLKKDAQLIKFMLWTSKELRRLDLSRC